MLTKIAKVYLDKISGTRLGELFESVGIEDLLSDIYFKCQRLKSILDHIKNTALGYLPQTTRDVEMSGIKASFFVKSGRERDVVPKDASEIPERETMEYIISKVKGDDVFWDVGSNFGIYACIIGQRLEKGKVVCFEPYPEAAERVQENIELNGIGDYSIKEVGLSDFNDIVEFEVAYGLAGKSGRVEINPDSNPSYKKKETINIPVRTGDDLLRNQEVPIPNMVKIDIDGEEYNALQGMRSILEHDKCRLVLCEIHSPINDGEPADVVQLIEESGFESMRIHSGGVEKISDYTHPGSADRLVFEKC